jgi:hypothetical protein
MGPNLLTCAFVVAWIIVVMIVGAGVWEVGLADESREQQFSTSSKRKRERERETENKSEKPT